MIIVPFLALSTFHLKATQNLIYYYNTQVIILGILIPIHVKVKPRQGLYPQVISVLQDNWCVNKTTQFPQNRENNCDWLTTRTGNVLTRKVIHEEKIRKVSTQKLMVELSDLPLTDTGQWRASVHSKMALMTTTAKDTVTDSHLYPQMYDHSKLPYHCWKTWPVIQDWGGHSSHCPILQMNIQF